MGSNKRDKMIINFIKRIFILYSKVLSFFVYKIFSIFDAYANKKLPPIRNKLLLIPATVLAQEIRTCKTTSESIVRAYIDRARDVNKFINAVVEERYDEALLEARNVDNYVRNSGKTPEELAKEKPFLGVPVTIKANIACQGMSYDLGLVSRKGIKSEKNADVKKEVDKSGFIIIAITNIPEMCCSWNSYNRIYGQTRNPYNLSRSSGGSSGGEGAMISSGASIVGVGNDMAGSIRIPCCLTGLFGHKPTRGLVSSKGIFPDNEVVKELLTNGPMCRYATDLGPFLEAMMKPEEAGKIDLQSKIDMKTLKVYYFEDDIGSPLVCPLTDEVRSGIKKAASYFETQYGITPTKLNLPDLIHSSNCFTVKSVKCLKRSLASILADDENSELDVFTELLKVPFGQSNFTSAALFFALMEKLTPQKKSRFYDVYEKLTNTLENELDAILKDEDAILIFPSFPEEAPHPLMEISKIHIISYYCLFNVLGFPSTQCPIGLSKNGLPLGVQIVGAKYKDHLTIAVANEIEKGFGGWKAPCPLLTS